jgi:hypothetical protein
MMLSPKPVDQAPSRRDSERCDQRHRRLSSRRLVKRRDRKLGRQKKGQ